MSIFNSYEQRATILDAIEGTVKLDMNVEGWLQDAFRDLYLLENARVETNTGLVAYWKEAKERGSQVSKKVTQQFSRAGKAIHEELGINYNEESGKYPGLKVDKELTSVIIAPTRNTGAGKEIESELVKLVKQLEAEPTSANMVAVCEALKKVELAGAMVDLAIETEMVAAA